MVKIVSASCNCDAAFPLTPALSLGERENPSQRGGESSTPGSSQNGERCPLSLGERVGVRGNGLSAYPIGATRFPELSFAVRLQQHGAQRRREGQRIERGN